jgi:hypothetical protein
MVGPEGRSTTARCFSTSPQNKLYSDEEFTSVHPSSPEPIVKGVLVNSTPPKGGGSEYTPERLTELNSTDDDIELPKC